MNFDVEVIHAIVNAGSGGQVANRPGRQFQHAESFNRDLLVASITVTDEHIASFETFSNLDRGQRHKWSAPIIVSIRATKPRGRGV